MWRKILVALGAGCGIYACVELARLILVYWKNVAWVSGFGLELVMLAIAIVWILISVIDDLFMKSDFLGGD